MKKKTFIYGLIAGGIVSISMVAGMLGLIKDPCSMGMSGMIIGYSTMLVAFSLIFVSAKNYRDKQNGGVITFGKVFRIGLLITLVASTIYVGMWMIYYYNFMPDFFDKYSAHMLAQLKADGATAAQLQAKAIEYKNTGELYKKPLVCAAYTYIEILPVGLIVSVICGLILMRKQPGSNVAVA